MLVGFYLDSLVNTPFRPGELITGGTSFATATTTIGGTSPLEVDPDTIVGIFLIGETILGSDSGAEGDITAFYGDVSLRMKSLFFDKNTWLTRDGFIYDIKHAVPELEENIKPAWSYYDENIVDCFSKGWSKSIKYLGKTTTDKVVLSTGWYHIKNQQHYLFSSSSHFVVLDDTVTTILPGIVDLEKPINLARYKTIDGLLYYDLLPRYDIVGDSISITDDYADFRTDVFPLTGKLNPNFSNMPVEIFQPTYWPPSTDFAHPTGIVDASIGPDAFTGTVSIYTTDNEYKLRVDNPDQISGELLRVTYVVGLAVQFEEDGIVTTTEVDEVDYLDTEVFVTDIDSTDVIGQKLLYVGNKVNIPAEQIKISSADAIEVVNTVSVAGEMSQFLVQTFDATGAQSPFARFKLDLSHPIGTINGWRQSLLGKTGSEGTARINYVAPITSDDMGSLGFIDGGDPFTLILNKPVNMDKDKIQTGGVLEDNIFLAYDDGERVVLLTDGSGAPIPASGLEDASGETDFTLSTFLWASVAKFTFPIDISSLVGQLLLLAPVNIFIYATLIDDIDNPILGTNEAVITIKVCVEHKALELGEGRIDSVFFLGTDVVPTTPPPAAEDENDGTLLITNPGFRILIVGEAQQFSQESAIPFRFIVEK